MLYLSSTSEDTSVVVKSSPEFYTERKLPLLDGRRLGVASALLTSIVAMGSQPVNQTVLLDRVVAPHFEIDAAERECAAEEEMVGSQTLT